jgi:hypothetical protein
MDKGNKRIRLDDDVRDMIRELCKQYPYSYMLRYVPSTKSMEPNYSAVIRCLIGMVSNPSNNCDYPLVNTYSQAANTPSLPIQVERRVNTNGEVQSAFNDLLRKYEQ